MKGLKRFFGAKEGFTLVEMTVVVAIIATLAALVLPAVTGVTTSTRGTSKIGDQKEIQQGVIRYADANGGSLPSSTTPTVSVSDTNADGTISFLIDNTTIATGGTTPSVDVTCVGATATAALDTCFGPINFTDMVPSYVATYPKHTNDYAKTTSGGVPTGDSDITTVDFSIANCDLAGDTCDFYLDNGDDLSALKVWDLSKDNTVYTFKQDNLYGK